MLSKELEYSLNNAFKNAHDKRHEFITVEHLLLALLENDTENQFCCPVVVISKFYADS